MGAGKTTLSKAFCSHFGINEEVNSPTFAIANIYTSESVGEIYHFDFYRLNTSQEALDIGFEDYVYSGNYCLIEWPNLVEHYIPRPFVEVEIRHIDKKTEREVTCKLIE
jgi:tRNA threonylcarbamoyladenosine biosynthesis protein TsaE